MGEPNQKDEAISSDEEQPGDNNQQEERQYNRFDLTGYSDDAAVGVFSLIDLFPLFKDIDLTQCVANEVPVLSRFQQLKVIVSFCVCIFSLQSLESGFAN